ncbi:class I lanthipeptide [uncultured Alistipes sp.]|jgi:hypothetical protein|uniref:class I lanthipeptide n=1 Tax=uncultured Alistipes sp. TaxID=538949 RepID=UPI0025E72392|nr:class I lanthipeptide [uncultured Alistipes sp.]
MKKLQLKKEVIEKLDDQKMGNAFGGNEIISLCEQNTCAAFCNTNASFRVEGDGCTASFNQMSCNNEKSCLCFTVTQGNQQ